MSCICLSRMSEIRHVLGSLIQETVLETGSKSIGVWVLGKYNVEVTECVQLLSSSSYIGTDCLSETSRKRVHAQRRITLKYCGCRVPSVKYI